MSSHSPTGTSTGTILDRLHKIMADDKERKENEEKIIQENRKRFLAECMEELANRQPTDVGRVAEEKRKRIESVTKNTDRQKEEDNCGFGHQRNRRAKHKSKAKTSGKETSQSRNIPFEAKLNSTAKNYKQSQEADTRACSNEARSEQISKSSNPNPIEVRSNAPAKPTKLPEPAPLIVLGTHSTASVTTSKLAIPLASKSAVQETIKGHEPVIPAVLSPEDPSGLKEGFDGEGNTNPFCSNGKSVLTTLPMKTNPAQKHEEENRKSIERRVKNFFDREDEEDKQYKLVRKINVNNKKKHPKRLTKLPTPRPVNTSAREPTKLGEASTLLSNIHGNIMCPLKDKQTETEGIIQKLIPTEKPAQSKNPDHSVRNSSYTMVIREIDATITDEKATKMIINENPRMTIEKATRILGRDNEPTRALKIVIHGDRPPKQITFCRVHRQAEIYLPPVIQCHNCQKFCHKVRDCKSKQRCRYCSGNHSFDNCEKAKLDSDFKAPNNARKCANCGGPHGARYQGCPEYQRTKQLLKESLESKVPIREIIKRQMNTNKPQNQPVDVTNEIQEIKTRVTKLQEQQREELKEERTILLKNQEILKEITQLMKEIKREVERMEELKTQNTEILRKIEKQKKTHADDPRTESQTKVTEKATTSRQNNISLETIQPLMQETPRETEHKRQANTITNARRKKEPTPERKLTKRR